MESPVTTHSYHLRSWSHRCSSSPTASTPTLPSSATWHIRLPWRLSWDNYSSSKELDMPQPFTPKLFNTTITAFTTWNITCSTETKPQQCHNVSACSFSDAYLQRPWSTHFWPLQTLRTLLLLWRIKIPLQTIQCHWWGPDEKACTVICRLGCYGVLGNPPWVHRHCKSISRLHRCSV